MQHTRLVAAFSLVAALVVPGAARALPKLEDAVPMPDEFNNIITIYPDSENTATVKRFWLVPSTARIVRRPNGTLAFGLVHSGVSGFDPDGVNALLNVTVQPYIDEPTVSRAKTLITQRERAAGATDIGFNFVSPTETTCQMLIGGQYYDWSGAGKTVIQGGAVEAGIPFQVKVTQSFDVRCLTQAGGPEAATFGALYTMKFHGIGNRVHFAVTANYKQSLEHFKVAVRGSAWFGLVQANARAEWTKFKDQPFVKLQVFEGTQQEVDQYLDKYGAQKLLNGLMEQLANRTGMFARTVQPSNLPDAPGGGGFLGWGVSVGGGFESVENETDLRYEVDLQFTREHEIAFGMNFATGGDELRQYVKNLTDTNKPFPTSDDFKSRTQQEGQCKLKNLKALKSLLDQGLIDQPTYAELVKDALAKGCFVSYEGVGASPTGPPGGVGSRVTTAELLQFTRMRRRAGHGGPGAEAPGGSKPPPEAPGGSPPAPGSPGSKPPPDAPGAGHERKGG
jgi:hypothetical protein